MAKVLLDCDGVLLHWDQKFAQWCRLEKGITPTLGGPTDWDLAHWLGVTSAQAFELVQEFNASRSFGNIWPCTNALNGVYALAHGGHEMSVITSYSDDPDTMTARRVNLRACFGDVFSEVRCLPLGGDKRDILGQYPKGCIWVEENYSHAVTGHLSGHHTFMVHRSHNKKDRSGSHPEIQWVTDWEPIISLADSITL